MLLKTGGFKMLNFPWCFLACTCLNKRQFKICKRDSHWNVALCWTQWFFSWSHQLELSHFSPPGAEYLLELTRCPKTYLLSSPNGFTTKTRSIRCLPGCVTFLCIWAKLCSIEHAKGRQPDLGVNWSQSCLWPNCTGFRCKCFSFILYFTTQVSQVCPCLSLWCETRGSCWTSSLHHNSNKA